MTHDQFAPFDVIVLLAISYAALVLLFAARTACKAASLYERAVNTEETAERHVLLAEALVLAERQNEALWHFGRAADLYDDRHYKASMKLLFV